MEYWEYIKNRFCDECLDRQATILYFKVKDNIIFGFGITYSGGRFLCRSCMKKLGLTKLKRR